MGTGLEKAQSNDTIKHLGEKMNKIIDYLNKIKPFLYFFYDGNAIVSTNLGGWLIGKNMTINKIKVEVDTAPVGSSIIFDFYINGTSIFLNTANRPTIGTTTKDDTVEFQDINTKNLIEGDLLTWGIAQIGSATAGGNDIYITVEM